MRWRLGMTGVSDLPHMAGSNRALLTGSWMMGKCLRSAACGLPACPRRGMRTVPLYQTTLNGMVLWFVGDIIMMGHECQSVDLGWNGGPDYNRAIYLETLRKLCHLECDCVFPGHGSPCIGGGRRFMEMAYTRAMTEWR